MDPLAESAVTQVSIVSIVTSGMVIIWRTWRQDAVSNRTELKTLQESHKEDYRELIKEVKDLVITTHSLMKDVKVSIDNNTKVTESLVRGLGK